MLLKVLFFLLMSCASHSLASYDCTYTCNTDPLMQIYPNQNMCLLLSQIPPALKNLDYVMYPNCDIYNTNRFGYNKRFNLFPTAIIVPQTAQEVQYVLGVLTQNNLPFSVRSGGHCYGPGSLSNGYILDLRNFDSIIPDVNKSTVTIGAGCHLGDVISALGALNYAIPTGTCPSVGVAGLALGGGIGLLNRKYGLTTDSIIAMTVVMADGSIINVTQQNFPDLFWALRGAGADAYGIVLDFTFKMHKIPEVSAVQLTWDWDPCIIMQVFTAWQRWFPTQSKDISSELIFVYKDGKSQLKLDALKVGKGPFNEWQNTFKPFDPKVFKYHGSYLGAAELFASNYTMPFSKVKSKFIFSPMSCQGLQVVINFFSELQALQSDFLTFIEFGGAAGGAIERGNSAYFPRKAFAYIFEFMYWPYEFQSTAALALLRKVYHELEPYTSPYSYANLVDYELGRSYLNAYYGTHVDRLVQIKNTYDPKDVFKWRQGIPLTVPTVPAVDPWESARY